MKSISFARNHVGLLLLRLQSVSQMKWMSGKFVQFFSDVQKFFVNFELII